MNVDSSIAASSIWGFAIVGGPILFAPVLLWAVLHNRQSKRERDRTEDGTRQLYEQSDRKSKRRDR